MAVDFTNFNAGMTALTAQLTQTQGIEASATALINGFAAAVTTAVTAALTADAAANQGSIDAAVAAIADTTSKFNASATPLGAAVAANQGPPPPPPPPPMGAHR